MTTLPESKKRLLFRNVRVFDGVSAELSNGDVLIDGNKVAAVSTSPVGDDPGRETVVIDGGGRVLMPGMSDAHVHLVGNANSYVDLLMGTEGHITLNGVAEAKNMLMRGFTAVRDMAGDTSSIKSAIDRGQFPGPRIYPCQAAISQTSGHGDFGNVYDTPSALGGAENRSETIGFMRIADGEERVLAAVREQLKKGASQIKMMVGGGAASTYDPLYTVQFTDAELRAGVNAATDYGTYVATHVYNVTGIRRAIEAGVKSIEHGHLSDETTVKLMAERDVWLSMQPFAEDDHHYPDADRAEKNRQICSGVDRIYGWAKKYGVKVAFGTDLLLEPQFAKRQSEMAARLGDFYSNVEALRMLTSGNAQLFRLAGERDPYRDAPFGVVAEGAWADVLLVDGNPLEDLSVLADPEKYLSVIVKDGQVVKNSL
ncbi:amidohydrolase family protein [Rhodococcus sp. TAF43]|uniref:metal-dependent hydrolase family protein n=1 Tax=unclassified Rhodococcus (in: high G+C Gram-positive bacteria) TaxID=192944 RepID=UPI000E0BB74B|nr:MULTISPECIES: amidohydrolase family protein [unclassified Rhodococcus (in: high G+C Gram-positive bacteria)]QKT11893.1 amidohydrolase family protein [Rhodococcus sp. W8901]RDI21076.1 imidazolonepropionase-like amidohydrolase [Rhodococcus sp. AG1013]